MGDESRGEILCRKVLEKFYEKPFPKCRPDFLVNPETGYNLELDGYNEELKIAFEYNGIQHYEYPNGFHKTEEEFFDQTRRDGFKKEICKEMGIHLISIPYFIKYEKIMDYIEYFLPENVQARESLDAPEIEGIPGRSITVDFSLI